MTLLTDIWHRTCVVKKALVPTKFIIFFSIYIILNLKHNFYTAVLFPIRPNLNNFTRSYLVLTHSNCRITHSLQNNVQHMSFLCEFAPFCWSVSCMTNLTEPQVLAKAWIKNKPLYISIRFTRKFSFEHCASSGVISRSEYFF